MWNLSHAVACLLTHFTWEYNVALADKIPLVITCYNLFLNIDLGRSIPK